MESPNQTQDQAIANFAQSAREAVANDELINMAGAFVESVMMVHHIPCDFDGLSLNVLRDPETHKLLAVVITPVDQVEGEDPVPRYDAQPSRVTAAKPKIVLAG
jgi:hypothetical protein